MPFDATPAAKPDPQDAQAAELTAFVSRIMANRPKRSQLGSMFDEREEAPAPIFRRHLGEG